MIYFPIDEMLIIPKTNYYLWNEKKKSSLPHVIAYIIFKNHERKNLFKKMIFPNFLKHI